MKLKEQLLRWTLIVRKIQNNPGISFEELQRTIMQELYTRGYDSVCSDSTLKRDIKELRKEFNLDIEYNRSTGGYELKQLKKNWLDVDCIIEPFELITAFDNREEIPEWIFIEKYKVLIYISTLKVWINKIQYLSFSILLTFPKHKNRANH